MAARDRTGDPAAAALDEVAEAADATADEQRQVAATSRRLRNERQRGASWREITVDGRARTLLGLIGMSARRLTTVGKRLRRALAVALTSEGLSTRQIGARFGVSHQRVSSLLHREVDGRGPDLLPENNPSVSHRDEGSD
jgi:transposase-like protein